MTLREYQMNVEELDEISELSRPVPYLLGTDGVPPSNPQEMANRFWAKVGLRMGFDPMSVVNATPNGRFQAEPIG